MKRTSAHTCSNWPQLLMLLLLLLPFCLAGQNVVINFSSMTPHVGQKLEIRLVNKRDLAEADRAVIDPISMAAFQVSLSGDVGENYFVDFYADHNGNGLYDAPPADHAWRINFDDQAGDTTLTFEHNTNFTDIMWITTATNEIAELNSLQLFPNPVISDIILAMDLEKELELRLDLFNSAGQHLRVLFSGKVPV